MSTAIRIGLLSTLKKNPVQCISIAEFKIVLIYRDNQFYALDDACPHKSASLCDGILDGNHIVCPWHGAPFDIETGRCVSPFAPKGIKVWSLSEKQGELFIHIPETKSE